MTKTELARLVRKARGMHYMRVSGTELRFYCPVNAEARAGAFDRGLPHMFVVHHLAWEKGTDVKAVTDALRRHLEDAEINGDDCTKWTDAERGQVR